MWMMVEKLSLAVTDGFLLRYLLDRKYGTFLRTSLCFNTCLEDLPLVHQKSVFRSILSFTLASGNQQSFTAFLIEILCSFKPVIISSFSFLG